MPSQASRFTRLVLPMQHVSQPDNERKNVDNKLKTVETEPKDVKVFSLPEPRVAHGGRNQTGPFPTIGKKPQDLTKRQRDWQNIETFRYQYGPNGRVVEIDDRQYLRFDKVLLRFAEVEPRVRNLRHPNVANIVAARQSFEDNWTLYIEPYFVTLKQLCTTRWHGGSPSNRIGEDILYQLVCGFEALANVGVSCPNIDEGCIYIDRQGNVKVGGHSFWTVQDEREIETPRELFSIGAALACPGISDILNRISGAVSLANFKLSFKNQRSHSELRALLDFVHAFSYHGDPPGDLSRYRHV